MTILLSAQPLTSDAVYTIVMILFTLSLISERLANLWKLAWPGTRNRSNNQEQEKYREFKVIICAMVFGWIVAFIAGADLFTLLRGGGLDPVFANDLTAASSDKQSPTVQYALGIFLSGIFISMGSKFWHDMLDIILQFANLKKFKVNKEASEAEAAELKALDARMRLVEPQLRNMEGYAGYDLVSLNGKVNLKFESDKIPNDVQISAIRETLDTNKFQINKTNIEP